MKRFLLITIISISLMPVSCKVDRGTILNLPFFSLFGGGSASTAGKAITYFAIINPVDLNTIGEATIDEVNKTITLQLPYNPYGINPDLLKSLMTKYSTTGTIVIYDGDVQESEVSVVDFSQSRKYTVVASDNTTQNYWVAITAAASDSKSITNISIPYVTISNLVLGDPEITLTVPYGTGLSLSPTITITGASISPASGALHDFTNPVTYRVTAYDSSWKDYTITITEAKNNACDITAFSFASYSDAVVIFNGTDNFNVTLPFGTDTEALKSLVANFTASTGATVYVGGVGGEQQTSGASVNNFENPVEYTVLAQNGIDYKDYTVNVSIDPGDAREFTSFSINDSINNVYTGTISGTSISVTLPMGTDLNGLVTNFAINGDHVTLNDETVPTTSGSLVDYRSQPVRFTVHAKNTSFTQTYQVTINLTYLLNGTNVVGYYHNVLENNACLWYIGGTSPVAMDLETTNSTAVSASVYDSSTVYVAGTYGGTACYWKISGTTKTMIPLTSIAPVTVVDSQILGDYLYISGTDGTYNSSGDACYWKVNLDDDSHVIEYLYGGNGATAAEMIVANNTIYIAGTAPDPDNSNVPTPCYWSPESATKTPYFGNWGQGYGRSVMYDGSNFIVGGWTIYNPPYTQAAYWKYIDTTVSAVVLPPVFISGTNTSVVSSSLYEPGYPLGYPHFAGQLYGYACYWYNEDDGITLPGGNSSFAYEIGLINYRVNITGYYTDASGTTACIWRKYLSSSTVTRVNLKTSLTGEAAARDVFIKN